VQTAQHHLGVLTVLNLRKFPSVLEVNPADAQNLDLVLGACPDNERHRALKAKADFLRNNLYEPEEAVEMLREWLTRAEKSPNEIVDTVRKSWSEIDEEIIVSKSRKPGNPLDTQQVLALFRHYEGYDDLVERMGGSSDVRAVRETTTDDWLRLLYRPTDLLCLGLTMYDTRIAPLSEILPRFPTNRDSVAVRNLKGLYRTNQYCLLTPAVYQERGIERNGKGYGRCDENILERRYWVVEFDIAEGQPAWKGILPNRDFTGFDLQWAIIFHLFEQGFPIVAIVHSGNKSLHMWCSGYGMTNEEIEAKILSTALYGADVKAGLTISQFFRLPNPTHPSRPQRLLYFDSDFINHGRTS
jgi:hypothetical protein